MTTTHSTSTSTSLTVGVLREDEPREHRVALDPGAVTRLVTAGRHVVVETGCGTAASFPDAAYALAGATVTDRNAVLLGCEVLVSVRRPSSSVAATMRPGQMLLGLLDPLGALTEMSDLASRGVTVVAFELLPRTLSRAQGMDALSSQASAAGYRAAVVATSTFTRYLPMMITASGTSAPARVLVVGTGVAGLQAIATARRLGAVVTGYDVREASRGEVESLGARFLTSSISTAAGEGGYARALDTDEQRAQQDELSAALHGFDIIITTAQVPGRTPPVLVTTDALASLGAGSVCVDLGASALGGNVSESVDGATIVTSGGVTVVGAGSLAADLPTSASQMYGHNVTAVIDSLAPDGSVVVDPADEVHRAIVVAHQGEITSERVRSAMAPPPPVPVRVPSAFAAPGGAA